VGREIERKFLLEGDDWRAAATERVPMSQGYIARSDRTSVRVRLAGERAWLNLKSGGLAASRQEFEYAIPAADARELLALAVGPLIEKTRHLVPFGGFEWEIDEFHGANAGLVVAEIELDDERQEFPLPAWAGPEVTHLARYYNVNLVRYPYSAWTEAERRGA
jgi:adenylate cyclase